MKAGTSTETLHAVSGNVGIGDTTPENKLTVVENQDNIAVVKARTTTVNGRASYQIGNDAANWFMGIDGGNSDAFIVASAVDGSDKLIITSSGNVGIGTSPQSFAKLQVKTDTNKQIAMFSNTDGATIGGITDTGASTTLRLAGSPLIMTGAGGSGSEHMRIDSSGNLLVGTDDNNVSDNSGASNGGINIGTAGVKGVISAAAGQTVAYLNRLGSDGDIAVFRKDGNTIGSLGSNTTSGQTLFDISSEADAASNIRFLTSSGSSLSERMRINSSGNVIIGSTGTVATSDSGLSVVGSTTDNLSIQYTGTTGGHTSKFQFVDFRGQVNASINNNLINDGSGTASAHLDFNTSVGGALSQRVRIGGDNQTETVFNDLGLNYDFRIESDAQTHMLFVDAGNNIVGVGMSPDTDVVLSVNGAVGTTNGSASSPTHTFYSDPNTGMFRRGSDQIGFSAGGTEMLALTSTGIFADVVGAKTTNADLSLKASGTGSVVVNKDALDRDFRVASDTNTHMLFVDASTDRVGIGSSSPSAKLDVAGDAEFENGKIIINEVTGSDAYSEIRKTNTGSNFAIVSPEAIHLLVDSNNDQTNRGVVIGHNAAAPGSATQLAVIGENGTVFNEPGADIDFRVESDSNTHAIFLDAGENRLGLFGSETLAATNYVNGICTKTGLGCYSVAVANISAGATSANIDIPFSRIGDGIAEFAFHAHGNGGTTNFGIVAHLYVQENPDRHTRVDVSSQQFTMSSSNSGSNIRITLTNGGSFTSEGGKLLIRKMV
jgi:hypothetical protein